LPSAKKAFGEPRIESIQAEKDQFADFSVLEPLSPTHQLQSQPERPGEKGQHAEQQSCEQSQKRTQECETGAWTDISEV
jgi:hypothetical protein